MTFELGAPNQHMLFKKLLHLYSSKSCEADEIFNHSMRMRRRRNRGGQMYETASGRESPRSVNRLFRPTVLTAREIRHQSTKL